MRSRFGLYVVNWYIITTGGATMRPFIPILSDLQLSDIFQ